VRAFPDVNAGRTQVSNAGGTEPRWARNSQELFYLAADNALMSVAVERGDTWKAGTPIKLIDGLTMLRSEISNFQTYDVSLDDKRFLIIKESSGPDQTPPAIEVVQNWQEELKRLVPTR
jgi:hypothetical protein